MPQKVFTDDLTGRRFGKWTVLERIVLTRRKSRYRIKCDCGYFSEVDQRWLLSGHTTQCNRCGHGFEDLVGRKFGKWTVIERIPRKETKDNRIWLARCECGVERRHATSILKGGFTNQCRKCSHALGRPDQRIRPYEALYRKLKGNAPRTGRECSITYDEFVSLMRQGRCHYCHAPIKPAEYCVHNNGQGHFLDRKDNTGGYTNGNVALCCLKCNLAKGDRYTYEEWWGMTAYFRTKKRAKRQPAPTATNEQLF